jgi:glycosyltransferase involved in cell wall biosynthesis
MLLFYLRIGHFRLFCDHVFVTMITFLIKGIRQLLQRINCVDIGIFAHNESDVIARLIRDLSRQTVFGSVEWDVHTWIMVNGSSDGTANVAANACLALPEDIRAKIMVVDIKQGGKSRTVHKFIHQQSRKDASTLAFMDADIQLPEHNTIAVMLENLRDRPKLQAFTSRPVKDVTFFDLDVGRVAKLIAAGGDGITNFRKSICGQLYALRAPMARRIALPDGLPVEDGFVRAMVLTDMFAIPEDLDRIDGDPAVFHIYESIRGIRELLHHQTRLVVGSAINAALYARFRRDGTLGPALQERLLATAGNADWLQATLAQDLPRRPFGYVPFKFATQRLAAFRKSGRKGLRARAILSIGVLMDFIVWCCATLRMLRGQGAGFW